MSLESYADAAEQRIGKQAPPERPFDVLGTNAAGQTMWGDFLPALRGTQGMRTLREMTDNDATIGSILYAMEMLLREVEWHGEPDQDIPADVDAAQFLDECMGDMEQTWPDFIAEDLEFLPFGHSVFEVNYGLRTAEDGSAFDDGRIRWREFGVRPQESISKWLHDEEGRLVAVQQTTAKGPVVIPREKLLLTRTTTTRPQGKSILRSAYTSWYYKKYVTEQTVIGTQRDLAGMPVAWIPAENLQARDGVWQAWKDIVTRSKKDELYGWLLPLEYDDAGNKLYEFEIVRGGGGNLRDAIGFIRMFAMDIATTVLAEFVGLGRDTVGSRALAEPKQELFQTTLEAWADVMQAAINKDAVMPLLQLNGMGRARLVHGPVKDTNVDDLARLIQAAANAGQEWSDEAATNRTRALVGYPPVEEDGA